MRPYLNNQSLKEKITVNFDERSPIFLMFIIGLLGWLSLLIFGVDWWQGISTETPITTFIYLIFMWIVMVGMLIYVPIYFIGIICIIIKHYIEKI